MKTEMTSKADVKSHFAPKEPKAFEFKDIKYEKKDWIATVTINRPSYFNAYSTLALEEMCVAFQDAAWDDGVAVVILTGEGHAAFSTGGDVKDYEATYTKRPREYWKWMGLFGQCHDLLRNIGKPTIARLNGVVVGGGNEFNMSCDLAIAADHVYIRQVGTRVGSVACGGATQWLPIMVGDRRAREMLFLCDEVNAKTAYQWGLVNKVVPSVLKNGKLLENPAKDEIKKGLKGEDGYGISLLELDKAVDAMAQKLIQKFPECLRYTKAQTNFWKDFSWHMTIGHAREWLSLHFNSPEPYEGMRAFVEKRPPNYAGIRERGRDGKATEFLWGAPSLTCPKCKTHSLPEEFSFCGKCGSPLSTEGK